MKFLRYICLIILFLPLAGNSQHILSGNYVINPSFEFYTQCPDGMTQITYAYPWSDCLEGGGSTDYYNFCSSYSGLLSGLSIQHPRTGNAMAGIINYGSWLQDNHREYLEGKLSNNLKKNKRYCGELYSSLVNTSKGAIENIGILFSKDTLWDFDTVYGFTQIIITNPQIENKKGIIKDTVNWVKVNGSFIADGGEKYLVIGNFRDNQHTNYIEVLYGIQFPYYFIDDVSVCECSFDINLGADTALCESETILLNPNLPNATYTWQDSSHAATYEVKQPGTYWVRAYVADYDITTTDTIVITAKDDNICNPPLTIPNIITPNGDSQNDNFVIQNSETYEIALQIYNRWGNIIYESTSYQNDFSCNNCADGVYFYVLKAKSKRNGREKEYKGSLTIIK